MVIEQSQNTLDLERIIARSGYICVCICASDLVTDIIRHSCELYSQCFHFILFFCYLYHNLQQSKENHSQVFHLLEYLRHDVICFWSSWWLLPLALQLFPSYFFFIPARSKPAKTQTSPHLRMENLS